MPRTTPFTCSKFLGNFFVIFVFLVLSFIYSSVLKVFGPYYKERSTFPILAIFHFTTFMFIWSFFKTMLTDPGIVPPLWGFYMGDSETKRRRYCLMCHVFKPDRCHHCSACNRCVLNMDHHCPWINNCVGFFNRKYFILLLIYALLTLYVVAISMFQPIYEKVRTIIEKRDIHAYSEGFIIAAYTLDCLLTMILTMFFKFHLKLVFSNGTTIETMDKNAIGKGASYNKGVKRNFEQVFGRNPWLWLLPITGESGKPIGDGVVWVESYQNLEEEAPGNEAEQQRFSPTLNDNKIPQDEAKGVAAKVLMSPPLRKINDSLEEDSRARELNKYARPTVKRIQSIPKEMSTGADSYPSSSRMEVVNAGQKIDSGRPIGKQFHETMSSPEI
ncbi:DHHC2_1 [Blepharisma stoltei]|uniref:Palmitoyltransferase n=1 Tax=Blepharisma stoltei TaxID=1481888 RepID=A0AAU9IMG2_9CILI|nr:unnamed protein product [Blepharisma stoltei]